MFFCIACGDGDIKPTRTSVLPAEVPAVHRLFSSDSRLKITCSLLQRSKFGFHRNARAHQPYSDLGAKGEMRLNGKIEPLALAWRTMCCQHECRFRYLECPEKRPQAANEKRGRRPWFQVPHGVLPWGSATVMLCMKSDPGHLPGSEAAIDQGLPVGSQATRCGRETRRQCLSLLAAVIGKQGNI